MLKERARILAITVFSLDLSLVAAGFFVAYWLRSEILPALAILPGRLYPLEAYIPLLALGLAGRAEAQLKAPEKASFVLSVDRTAYDPGAPAKVAALVSIEHGWHVNSHKPSFDCASATALRLDAKSGSNLPFTFHTLSDQSAPVFCQPSSITYIESGRPPR